MKHRLPLGTKVCFDEDFSRIVVVDQYSDLLMCEPGCSLDHDCFPEPHVNVRVEYWTSLPLSKLKHVFDQPNHAGRNATDLERTPIDE